MRLSLSETGFEADGPSTPAVEVNTIFQRGLPGQHQERSSCLYIYFIKIAGSFAQTLANAARW